MYTPVLKRSRTFHYLHRDIVESHSDAQLSLLQSNYVTFQQLSKRTRKYVNYTGAVCSDSCDKSKHTQMLDKYLEITRNSKLNFLLRVIAKWKVHVASQSTSKQKARKLKLFFTLKRFIFNFSFSSLYQCAEEMGRKLEKLPATPLKSRRKCRNFIILSTLYHGKYHCWED